MRYSILPLMLTATLGTASAPVLADWNLDPARSDVTYVTIKAKDIAENNSFKEMEGHIDSDGQAVVTLMLDSVETLVPIRNERMRQILFDTADYKEAKISAKIDPEKIASLGVGEVADMAAEGNLSLHGKTQPVTLSVKVARLDPNTLLVTTTKPILLDAAKFGLGDAVEKLREIAGLASISDAVPVVFVGTFVEAPVSGQ